MALYCYLETQSSQASEHQIQQSGRTRASIRPHIMQTVFKIASCWSWWNYKSRIWCSMPVIYDHRSLQAECFQGTSSLLVICMQLILLPKRFFFIRPVGRHLQFWKAWIKKKNDLFSSITTSKQTSMQNVILKQLTYYLQVRCLLFCHLQNDKLSHLAADVWTGPAVCSV